MRRALVILLVLVLLVALLPVGMGMSLMLDCPSCAPTRPVTVALCVAVLAVIVTAAARPLGWSLHVSSWRVPELLLARSIDRPPRLV
jgi:hypothetical protein